MERVQKALAKARAERQQGRGGTVTRVEHPAAPARNDAVEAAWAALAPIRINNAHLKRHRLVALNGGRDSAPYDLLRTKIIHQTQINNWRRVAVVSPDIGAGKTTTVANLAFSFERQRDMRVLCIDLDLRRPALHRVLGQSTDHSMGDVLEGRVRFAEHGLRLGERVGFGLNNSAVHNPSELLLSRTARDTLDAIEAEFEPDLVFFDISPLNVSDDNIAFLQNVDCAVIVAAAEATPLARIDQAERQVAELTNVMGMVLNKCHYTNDADGYGYY